MKLVSQHHVYWIHETRSGEPSDKTHIKATDRQIWQLKPIRLVFSEGLVLFQKTLSK